MMKISSTPRSHNGRELSHRAIATTARAVSAAWMAGPMSVARAGLIVIWSGVITANDRVSAMRSRPLEVCPASMSLTWPV
jgi:hypothetical protein